MRSLNRKLLRDLWHLRGQMTAIILVVICGVATVITSRVGYESLELSRTTYYADYRFADVFASLTRAPDRVARELATIPGITEVHPRMVFDVTLDVPGLAEPATGRLTSIPNRRRPILNDVHIGQGRYPEPGRANEVLVNEGFAEANHLALGDSIGAVLNGRWARLEIVGFALSPEYVYAIPPGGLFPDDRRFAIVWMSDAAAGPAFDMDGAFNNVVFRLDPKANQKEVIARIDRILEPFGGTRAYGRDEHVSDRFLSDEIRQNREFGLVLPMLFLTVAAFLLNVLLARLISLQRDQIGVLKAFGYDRATIALHYLAFAVLGVLVGGILGTGIGIWLGAQINQLYVTVYRFPVLAYVVNPSVIVFATVVTLTAAMVGGLGAMRRAWNVPAAEAMRPEPPAQFRAGLVERLGLRTFLSPAARIIVRNLARRPLRAAASTLGIAFAVAILLLGRYFVDAISYLGYVQFQVVQRDDVTLVSHEPLPARARYELARLPGVVRSEDFRQVMVELRHGPRARKTVLFGLQPDDQLRRLVDRHLDPVDLPSDGVLMTTKLGEILELDPGDEVTVEVLEGARPVRRVVVAGFVDELIGLTAYMDRRALGRLLREDATVSGALLRLDAARQAELFASLKDLPVVSGVRMRRAAITSFEETLAKSLSVFTSVIVTFSCILAFAVIYNAGRIALSERGRELASLRVLGFTQAEISAMLLGEQALLTTVALPIGFGLGYWICSLLSDAYQWELFRLPLIITAESYIFAIVVVIAASVVSAAIMRHRLTNLDLVAVLKTRE